MNADHANKKTNTDKVLTVQVHHQNLDPRTFKVPVKWIYRSSLLAWLLIVITLTSVFFAAKTYRMKTRGQVIVSTSTETEKLSDEAQPKQTAGNEEDSHASDTKPENEVGQPLEGKDALWTGLAPNIVAPPKGFVPNIDLGDVKINWQGKFATISGVVAYREQGKGSQQGHIVVLARGKDRIYAHPETALNTANSAHLFNAENGEYFSVSRFRLLKTKLGPFENQSQLEQVQIFIFDLENKLILTQSFQHGKK
jgi:hypothetical protein